MPWIDLLKKLLKEKLNNKIKDLESEKETSAKAPEIIEKIKNEYGEYIEKKEDKK